MVLTAAQTAALFQDQGIPNTVIQEGTDTVNDNEEYGADDYNQFADATEGDGTASDNLCMSCHKTDDRGLDEDSENDPDGDSNNNEMDCDWQNIIIKVETDELGYAVKSEEDPDIIANVEDGQEDIKLKVEEDQEEMLVNHDINEDVKKKRKWRSQHWNAPRFQLTPGEVVMEYANLCIDRIDPVDYAGRALPYPLESISMMSRKVDGCFQVEINGTDNTKVSIEEAMRWFPDELEFHIHGFTEMTYSQPIFGGVLRWAQRRREFRTSCV
jgi:hypothetical protein